MDQIDKEELLRKRDELTPWLAPIYLGQGVWTRSPETVNPAKVNWYMDTMELFLGGLKGKRVLDIGSNTGYVACEAALRGAEVVSIEPHPENYLRCKLVYEARGVLDKNLILTKDDMEKIDINTFGKFDGIFFCGTIYHCQEPWVVLSRYYEMTNVILVESRLCPDDEFNKELGEYKFKAIYEKFGSPLHTVNTGTVLHPTRKTLFYMLRDTGFTNIHQLMPYPEMNPKYLAEECIAFLCNKQGKKPLEIQDEFDKQS